MVRNIENSSQVKKNSFQSKIIYPEKLPFKNEGETKTFPDKHKWERLPPKDLHTRKKLKSGKLCLRAITQS